MTQQLQGIAALDAEIAAEQERRLTHYRGLLARVEDGKQRDAEEADRRVLNGGER